MITAKNYAAQAEKGLEWYKKHLNRCGFLNDVEQVDNVIHGIKRAVKFAIPDNGRIFDDDLKGLKGSVINMPFPVICIEFYQENKSNKREEIIEDGHTIERMSKVVLLCVDTDNDVVRDLQDNIQNNSIFISMINFYESDQNWQLNDIGIFIKKDSFVSNSGFTFTTSTPENFAACQGKYKVDINDITKGVLPYIKAFFEFSEALTCTNVEISTHQPASPKNAQRIKSHKLPIYETKILTIKAGKESLSNAGNGIKGSHASPRQHLRRGHIRRLESGNIWVNSCVVGSRENGVIDKQYRVVA